MNKFIIALLALSLFTLTGCAVLDKLVPAQYDEEGNFITREPTEITKAVAGAIPYGDVALYAVLLLSTGWQKYKRNKVEKGLKATLMAGKQVANDPKMAELWEKLKEVYRKEHEDSGSTALIKNMLAKLPSFRRVG